MRHLGLSLWLALSGTAAAGEFDVCPDALAKGWRGGADDRIFYYSDFSFNPVPGAVFSEVDRLFTTLEARGVKVIVLPIPTPAHLAGKKVQRQPGDTWDPAQDDAIYNALRDRLGKKATVVDLLQIARTMPDDFYYKRDYHWTPKGAEAAAKAVADIINKDPRHASMPKADFEAYEADKAPWKTSSYSRLVGEICGKEMAQELAPTIEVRRKAGAAVSIIDETPPPEIAVVGSSFMYPVRGFGPYLMQATHNDALTVFLNGGEALGALMTYLRSDDFQQNPPKFLVWSVSVNSMGFAAPPQKGTASFQEPLIYRQIVPSAAGDCTNETAVLTGKADVVSNGSVTVITNPEGKTISGKQQYLSLRMRNPAVDSFQVVTEYADGTVDNYPFIHHQRIESNGRFFLSFLPNAPDTVSSVSITFPEGASGAVTARVCNMPSPE